MVFLALQGETHIKALLSSAFCAFHEMFLSSFAPQKIPSAQQPTMVLIHCTTSCLMDWAKSESRSKPKVPFLVMVAVLKL